MTVIEDVRERGGAAEETLYVLRYRGGRPITRRRYDYLWQRLGDNLPWVRTQNISVHWLRHTTLTWVAAGVTDPDGLPA